MTASESQRRTNPTSYTNGWVKTSAERGNEGGAAGGCGDWSCRPATRSVAGGIPTRSVGTRQQAGATANGSFKPGMSDKRSADGLLGTVRREDFYEPPWKARPHTLCGRGGVEKSLGVRQLARELRPSRPSSSVTNSIVAS